MPQIVIQNADFFVKTGAKNSAAGQLRGRYGKTRGETGKAGVGT